MSTYVLVEGPGADNDLAIYRFETPEDPTRVLLHKLVFGATQGLSKNIYKLYSITVVFKDMSHKEALEYCATHKSLNGFTAILTGT